ncbi:MAG: hypothetical protein ISR69_09190 [Gammaproteobacteria bacterium]|nr:hypothetical protein [Gammaproteobacteria bacterium]
MFKFFSSSKKNNVIGVEFKSTGIAVVEAILSGKKAGMIVRHDFIEGIGQQEQELALNSWVKENDAEKTICHCLVSQDDYNLFQVEHPEVSDEEATEAIKWKIKDLLSFDVDNAVIESYPMPESSKTTVKQINVVAANDSAIRAYIEVLKHSGLELDVLDISELALNNIFKHVDLGDNTIGVLLLTERRGQLYVFKKGVLYVVRDFKIGLNQLKNTESPEETYDSVLLEVQRSLDYFEGYYGIGGISKLYISPQLVELESMANYLQNYVSFELDFLTASNICAFNENLDFDHRCFMAYCLALRED